MPYPVPNATLGQPVRLSIMKKYLVPLGSGESRSVSHNCIVTQKSSWASQPGGRRCDQLFLHFFFYGPGNTSFIEELAALVPRKREQIIVATGSGQEQAHGR
jgi:hypothetical protein